MVDLANDITMKTTGDRGKNQLKKSFFYHRDRIAGM
jgi:hypothetical protein